MAFIAGIDEAGRGPVLGPLVICIAYCDRSDERQLKRVCKKDSKQLTAAKRAETYAALKGFCHFKLIEIGADEIDKRRANNESLNDIEAKGMAGLVKHLPSNQSADIMIDLPDRYEWIFRKRMEKFGVKKFEAQHKADENYSIVAAASIAAKLRRDAIVEEIKSKTGVDFGSGYPSDPKTRAVLLDKGALAKLRGHVRTSWETMETIKQRKLFED
ncbi:TPA: ribonuclease HII [Candidatus Micrarchaeota archaeon]|nr:ribonuclease HII [Candidatus Micrarchaeota archaeon]